MNTRTPNTPVREITNTVLPAAGGNLTAKVAWAGPAWASTSSIAKIRPYSTGSRKSQAGTNQLLKSLQIGEIVTPGADAAARSDAEELSLQVSPCALDADPCDRLHSLTADQWGYVIQTTTELRQRRDDGARDRATAHPHQAFTRKAPST